MHFVLPLPIGVNHSYRSGYNRKTGKIMWYKDAKATSWMTEALWEIRKQRNVQEKIFGDRVIIVFYRADKRRFDLDGPIKPVLDALVKGEVLRDDSDVTHLEVRKEKGEKNYCEVTVL